MEFKVFKNETGKILKEYWLTPSEWDALDKTTVQEGDIYHIVGTLDKGDLSADVNASLSKADSSLQKPTATLAKESFVKVGIDGTESFDSNSYVVAPLTDGTAGQVLKKTADGTEWADESGGSSVEVVQTTGQSTTAVMSQKAVTDELDKKVDTTSAQTISGIKTFSNYIKTPQVANSNGNALIREKSMESKSVFGNDSTGAVIMGNTDRPYYSKSGSDFTGEALALLSDIGQSSDLTNSEFYDDLSTATIEPGLYIIQCYNTSNNLVPYTVYTHPATVDNVYMSFVFVARNSITSDTDGKFEQFIVMQTMTATTTLADYFRTGINYTSLSKFAITFAKSSSSYKFLLRRIEAGNLSTTSSGSSVPDDLSITEFLYLGDFGTGAQVDSCTFYWGDGTDTTYTNGSVPEHTYSDGVSIHKISIEGLTSLPDNLFTEQTNLYGITLGNTTTVDMACFSGCTNLKTIRIQDNADNVLPITANDMSVFTYNFDYVNFRIIVPRRLYVKLLENNANISTEYIWNFVVPDDSYVCSHSIQLSGSNNYTYEVMLYSTCKLPLNQVPLATNPSTGTEEKRDILRELVDGETAYKYNGDNVEGFGSLMYSDSDNKYHIALCTGFGNTKTDETFDLNEITSDIVKLK